MNIQVKKSQNKLLNMGIIITGILERNNIPYMIGFGTLLGAVRHGGFIPWDDDFDLQLFEDSYDDAIKVLKSELPENLFLEDSQSEPKYFHSWAHVKDMNTITECKAFPHDNYYVHKGLSVDLYILRKMRLSQLRPFLNQENRRYIERRREVGLMSDEEYSCRMEKLKSDIESAEKEVVQEDRVIYGFTTSHKRHYLECDDVLPLKRIHFENHDFWGPAQPLTVITSIYGRDFLILPPPEKRWEHYDSVVFLNEE